MSDQEKHLITGIEPSDVNPPLTKRKLIAAYNKRWREQLINEHMMLEA